MLIDSSDTVLVSITSTDQNTCRVSYQGDNITNVSLTMVTPSSLDEMFGTTGIKNAIVTTNDELEGDFKTGLRVNGMKVQRVIKDSTAMCMNIEDID